MAVISVPVLRTRSLLPYIPKSTTSGRIYRAPRNIWPSLLTHWHIRFPPTFVAHHTPSSWGFIPANQIKGNLHNSSWALANSTGAVADIFTLVFSRMGNCRAPLYITPTMAWERFEMWSSLNTRRMNHRNWPLSSPSVDTTDLHPALPVFRAAAERNLDRARRCLLRACGTSEESGIIAPSTNG